MARGVTESPERVLVVGPAWIGDMVMSQVLYRYLSRARPGIAIDVLAPPWSAPLLMRMPEVRRHIDLPAAHGELALGLRRTVGRALRAAAYDRAIVLPNSLKSALVPWFARVPLRTGWRGEMRYGLLNDLRLLDRAALPRMSERFLALGLPPGEALPEAPPRPALAVDSAVARARLQAFGMDFAAPLLALCPGAAGGGAKRWPAEYYAQVARHCLGRGWQVALFGSAAERRLCARIAAASGPGRALTDLAGRTTLDEAIDLLSRAAAVVSNDSGLLHVAAATGRPLLAVYGPTSPDFTPPLAERAAVLRADIDCAPCHRRECPLGHHRCLREITPAQVIARLEMLIDDRGTGG